MHGSLESAVALASGVAAVLSADESLCQRVEVLLIPPFVHLSAVKSVIAKTPLLLGAQDLAIQPQGAFTGEVSGAMLRDVGCEFVLVGHSERRILFHEDDHTVARKFKAALVASLTPILCVGETQAERESGQTDNVIASQLATVLEVVEVQQWARAVIAYEPVWAIGTGLTATPDAAETVHAFIRGWLEKRDVAVARAIRILYGGSMKPENAKALLAKPNIDGGLIGGAALAVDAFVGICQAV